LTVACVDLRLLDVVLFYCFTLNFGYGVIEYSRLTGSNMLTVYVYTTGCE